MFIDQGSEVADGPVVRPADQAAPAEESTPDEGAKPIAARATAQLAYEQAVTAAEARAVAAATATKKAFDQMRQIFADVIRAEVEANEVLTERARTLSRELGTRKETEARLLERESELAAFAGMVAHDLKGPLRAVSGFTTLLRSDVVEALPGALSAPMLTKMDRILAAADQMRHLVDDQLAFVTVRDRILDVQAVDLGVMISDIVCDLPNAWPEAAEWSPTVEIGPIPGVWADPVACRQLLDNLIGNALKYTVPDRPARIRISGCAVPDPSVPTGMVAVEIADQGVGIPTGRHEKIFVSFYRAHSEYPGTGLGLAICRRIVERHGGTIAAADNPGGGSIFRFTLPAVSVPPSPSRAAAG